MVLWWYCGAIVVTVVCHYVGTILTSLWYHCAVILWCCTVVALW